MLDCVVPQVCSELKAARPNDASVSPALTGSEGRGGRRTEPSLIDLDCLSVLLDKIC